jgi:hypothetical protein
MSTSGGGIVFSHRVLYLNASRIAHCVLLHANKIEMPGAIEVLKNLGDVHISCVI